jgi:hypothetical protein
VAARPARSPTSGSTRPGGGLADHQLHLGHAGGGRLAPVQEIQQGSGRAPADLLERLPAARFSAATKAVPLRMRETVLGETPAARATSTSLLALVAARGVALTSLLPGAPCIASPTPRHLRCGVLPGKPRPKAISTRDQRRPVSARLNARGRSTSFSLNLP